MIKRVHNVLYKDLYIRIIDRWLDFYLVAWAQRTRPRGQITCVHINDRDLFVFVILKRIGIKILVTVNLRKDNVFYCTL